MTISHSLERIVVVPRNGYVNRLQAWASAAVLGAELDVPVQVLWEPEGVAPAEAGLLFGNHVVRRSFVNAALVHELAGVPHADLPRYLTVDSDRHLVILAGHDVGEQALMKQLGSALADSCRPRTLLIIAGGKFHLSNPVDFALQRRLFYAKLEWHSSIGERVHRDLEGRPPYIGLHVRETDRSREAPSPHGITKALKELAVRTGLRPLFVTADSAAGRERWTRQAERLGLDPWSASSIDFDRGSLRAGQDAIVDWLLLGRARAVTYSATSSFGEEAVVAADGAQESIALSASYPRQRMRDVARLAEALLTYPNRRWRA